MKAKVKDTGDIINVVFITHPNPAINETYWWCEDNQIAYHESELDFMGSTIDWEQRRYEIAKEAMSGILSDENCVGYASVAAEYSENEKHTYPTAVSRYAVACADALIKELKEGEGQHDKKS